MLTEHIHWYLFDGCNLDCAPCFQPHIDYDAPPERLDELARILAHNKVKKVTLGGGEPTLEPHLEAVLELLAESYTSIHTNATLLTPAKIKGLYGLVQDVGIPIDSTTPETQARIRCNGFVPVLERLPQITDQILANGIEVGYHTIFTTVNSQDMSAIHDLVAQRDFSYWRIYEFNDYLALTSLAEKKLCLTRAEHIEFHEQLQEIRTFRGLVGGQDCPDLLTPMFAAAKEKMDRIGDPRIQFVSVTGVKKPYAFLDNLGNITTYDGFSGTRRLYLGNIVEDGFGFVAETYGQHVGNVERRSQIIQARQLNP